MLTILLPTSCQQRPAQLELTQAALSPAPVQPSLLAPASPETATRTVVATTTHTATATQTAAPTQTKTPTSTATATPEYPPETRLSRQCVELLPALPDGFQSNGTIVFGSYVSLNIQFKPPFILNMATMGVVPVEKPEVISPDYKYIVSWDTSKDAQGNLKQERIVITNANGERQQEIDWKYKDLPNWLSLLGWSPDNRLVFSQSEWVQPIEDHLMQYSYLLFDPKSGQSEMLQMKLPGVIPTYIKVNWDGDTWGWFATMLNPQRTHLVYPRLLVDGNENEEVFTFALWDVAKQTVVASMESAITESVFFSARFPTPRWSPDGKEFIFYGHRLVSKDDEYADFELYKVNLDGQIEQLTNLTPAVPLWDALYSWSPDGQKIALVWSEYENHVGMLDLKTLAITEYCVPFEWVPYFPVWSPDGKQFLIVDRYAEDHQQVILVDTESGLAAPIAEDVIPIGWLVDTP